MPSAGDDLGAYRLEALLGRGGMSVVYRALDLRLGRRVALKVMSDELARDADFRRRFQSEARSAAAIDHPNVIPIYEAGEVGGVLYLAMRLVDGPDLGVILANDGPLGRLRTMAVLRQVAAALDAAHDRGLIHRDVKPGNVLIAKGGHVYLTDFGITKRTTAASSMTRTGQIVGTPGYLAPEQIERLAVGPSADIYALGCMLFECLTGTVPFEGETPMATLYAHVHHPPPGVTERRAELPRALDVVMARALAKSPADRYPSAVSLIDDATAAVTTGAVPSQVPTVTVQPSRAPVTQSAPIPAVAIPQSGATVEVPDAGMRTRPPHRRGKRRRVLVPLLIVTVLAAVGITVALLTSHSNGRTHRTAAASAPTVPVSTATTAAPPAPAPTRVTLINPFGAGGPAPGVRISYRSTGSCQASHSDNSRADAYRCFLDQTAPSGGNIADPCFSDPFKDHTYLLCFESPTDLRAVEVQPTSALPTNTETAGDPWFLQLSDGQMCGFTTGATGAIGNMRLNYSCPAGAIYGDPDRSQAMWTALYQANGSTQLVQVAVRDAYT